MIGLHGQTIYWKGEDSGWYILLFSGGDGVQICLRFTAPFPAEVPGRQLITGFALKRTDGHSLVINTKNPYTIMTNGCFMRSTSPVSPMEAWRWRSTARTVLPCSSIL